MNALIASKALPADTTALNIHLVKANSQALPFKLTFFAICGLSFVSALLFWPARMAIRRIRRKSSQANAPAVGTQQSRWLLWTGALAALTSLFSLFCLGMVYLVPNLVFVPWPRPYLDLLWWQFAGLSLPYTSLLLAVGIAVLTGLAIHSRAWTCATRFYYSVVALTLLAFNLALLF